MGKKEVWRIRKKIQRMVAVEECTTCGEETHLHRHHKDGNLRHNRRSNIVVLCVRCHLKEHSRMRSRKTVPAKAMSPCTVSA